jgi:diacylglycerol kinase family enzyme
MKALALINEAAGSINGQPNLAHLLKDLAGFHGIKPEFAVISPSRMRQLREEMAQSRWDAVLAGGGDGTVSSVAEIVAGTGIPLGILPLGTRNHFARDLNIPLELEQAIRCISQGATIQIDVGEVNGRVFINNSSIGFYPRAVEQRESARHQFGWSKMLAGIWAALKVFVHEFPVMKVRLHFDGEFIRRRTPFVFVGNNLYEMNLFALGARARLDAGNLSVYAMRSTGLGQFLALLLRALFNRLEQSKNFDIWTAPQVQIELQKRAARVAKDGEIIKLPAPLHYRIRPKDLRVLVPQDNSCSDANAHANRDV